MAACGNVWYDAAAYICTMVTTAMMDEDNILLCKKCRDKGVNITLENMFYPALENAIEVFHEMYEENGEEFDAYVKAAGQVLDTQFGRRDTTETS